MEYFGLFEKNELDIVIREAKKSCLNSAMKKLKEYDPMNPVFLKAVMPDDTPAVVIKKRTNKLAKMKMKKDLKRLMG